MLSKVKFYEKGCLRMSISDLFKVKQFKQEIEKLQNENINLKTENEKMQEMLTPEMKDAVALKKHIVELNSTIEKAKKTLQKYRDETDVFNSKLKQIKRDIIETEDEILVQSFGLYSPKYDFVNSQKYKSRLDDIRQRQKDLIKSGEAATGRLDYSVDGSAAKGKKMVKDMQKLLIRAFNSESDELIDKVKYSNFDTALKRLNSSYEAISKLGSVMGVSIAPGYYNLKLDELHLAFEYRQKQQEEKEQQRALKEQMREEAKLQKEIEAERKKIEKEQTHYQNALKSIVEQIDNASEEEKTALILKKNELEEHLADIDKAFKDIDYREANQKAGYVYIISNIGSFGENVYKIGMTRRLDPMDRVSELGDASVPFDFDVHAMIFSDDAPALEAALHRAFEKDKVNMVNQRREFFNVTLDEIKEVVNENFDKTVEFIDVAEAEQYRVTQKMKGL